MGYNQNSTFGFGSSGRGGGGGTVNDANNGLSLVGGTTVVLGQEVDEVGNPAMLLGDREIPLNNFTLGITGDSDGSTKANFTFISNVGTVQHLFRVESNASAIAQPQILISELNSAEQCKFGMTDQGISYIRNNGSDKGINIFPSSGNVQIGTLDADNGFQLEVRGNTGIEGNPIDSASALNINMLYSGGDVLSLTGQRLDISSAGSSGSAVLTGMLMLVTQETDSATNGVSIQITSSLSDSPVTGLNLSATTNSGLSIGSTVTAITATCEVADATNEQSSFGLIINANSNATALALISGGRILVNSTGQCDASGLGVSVQMTGSAGTGIGLSISSTNSNNTNVATGITVTAHNSNAGPATGMTITALAGTNSDATGIFVNAAGNGSGNSYAAIFLVGRVGINTGGPTARLHIAAQGAGVGTAPIKLTSNATLQATAETGAFEYSGTNLFFVRTGTSRENVWCGNSGAAAPGTTAGVTIANFYGTSATNFLGQPNNWASMVLAGTTFKIPLYT